MVGQPFLDCGALRALQTRYRVRTEETGRERPDQSCETVFPALERRVGPGEIEGFAVPGERCDRRRCGLDEDSSRVVFEVEEGTVFADDAGRAAVALDKHHRGCAARQGFEPHRTLWKVSGFCIMGRGAHPILQLELETSAKVSCRIAALGCPHCI